MVIKTKPLKVTCERCQHLTPIRVSWEDQDAEVERLLEALELSLEWLDDVCNPDVADEFGNPTALPAGLAVRKRIKAAIAKAKGGA